MSRWLLHLQKGETVIWEGRPAPRAFTFRNWRWSVGTMVLMGAILAGSAVVGVPIDGLLAAILALAAFWGVAGHLLYARLAWEKEFYVLTDRRLLVRSGIIRPGVSAFCRQDLKGVSVRSIGSSLATILVERRGERRPVRLFCIEHPELLLDRLLTPAGQQSAGIEVNGQR